MGMVVRSNIMAINANRSLGMNNSQVSKSLEKLSSGFKINRAGDDAAGLAISEKMKAQIKGLEQASTNSQDGISLVQTAEGALTEVHSMLNRMVELATKSANGTIQDEVDREAIQSEVDALLEEIDRVGNSTNFNGIKLLDGTMASITGRSSKPIEAYGISADDNVGSAVQTDAVMADATSAAVTALGGGSRIDTGDTFDVVLTNSKTGEIKKVSVSMTVASADNTAAAIGTAMITSLKANDTIKGMFGVVEGANTPDGTIKFTATEAAGDWTVTKLQTNNKSSTNMETVVGNAGTTVAAGTPAADAYTTYTNGSTADFVAGDTIVINGKKFEIVDNKGDKATRSGYTAIVVGATDQETADAVAEKAGVKITSQGSGVWKIEKKDDTAASGGSAGLTLQIGDTGDSFNMMTVKVGDMRSDALGLTGLDVSNADAARSAIDTIKAAINVVSTNRADMGALQNRLEHTINNLDVAVENMTSANSRIRDTDMAKEMMQYTQQNVLTQAAQAMLAQANQQPQSILQLLQ